MSTKRKILWAYGALLALYTFGTLALPPAKATLQKYHVSLLHLRLLDLTFIVLYGAIWYCGMYGFYSLSHYHQSIKKNKDGHSLAKIAMGIGMLAFWLPVTAVCNVYAAYAVQRNPQLAAGVAIAKNYLSLLLPLVGFTFIGIGARGLSELAKQRPTLRATNVLAIVTITVGVVYSHLVSVTHNRLNSIYHLPTSVLLITLVAPYIYMWFTGLLAVYEIYIYRLKIPGVLYRKSWRVLALGLGAIVGVSILIQYLTTISQQLTRLSLNRVLLLVYALLILLSVGFVLIALGARNLKKIEEV